MPSEFESSPYATWSGKFVGHKDHVSGMAWSPRGDWLASCSVDGALNLWSVLHVSNHPRVTLPSLTQLAGVSWSPDGQYIAAAGMNGVLDVWEVASFHRVTRGDDAVRSAIRCVAWAPGLDPNARRLAFAGDRHVHFRNYANWDEPDQEIGLGHESPVTSLAWSPDGGTVVTGTDLGTIGVWTPSTHDNQLRSVLSWRGIRAHDDRVTTLAWSIDTNVLASGGSDGRVHLWNVDTRSLTDQLVFDDAVLDIEFACAGRLLVVQTRDHLRFLRVRPLREIHSFSLPAALSPVASCIAVDGHSKLATIDSDDRTTIVVSKVNFDAMLNRTWHRVAGVSVWGEPQSGCTNLIRALTNEPFLVEPPPHTFDVHRLTLSTISAADGDQEHRAIAFWDLPSLAEHSLLSTIQAGGAAALMLLRPHPGRPLIAHENLDRWRRTLSRWNGPLKRHKDTAIVVITKCDELSCAPSASDVESIKTALSIGELILTSAKSGVGVKELLRRTVEIVKWSILPAFPSVEMFKYLTRFIDELRSQGRFLTSVTELSDGFARYHPSATNYIRSAADFINGIRLLQVLGEVQLFEGRDEILLHRPYYYRYAAAMIAAAQRDGTGMGRLALIEAETGHGEQLDAVLADRDRMVSRKQEERLLALTVYELREKGACQHVSTDGVSYLVFPMSLRRVRQTDPPRPEPAITFRITGEVDEMFDSLIVRLLGLDDQYPKYDLWKHEGLFAPAAGGGCGIVMRPSESGDEAECGIYFDDPTADADRLQFANRVRKHFKLRARSVTDEREEKSTRRKNVADFVSAESTVDVFLSWPRSGADLKTIENVRMIKAGLEARGIRLTEDSGVKPGKTRDEYLAQFDKYHVAVFLMAGQLSGDQLIECERLNATGCRIIPVILPNAPKSLTLTGVLARRGHIDFRGTFLQTDTLARAIEDVTHTGTPVSESSSRNVFLSYSRSDYKQVGQLRRALEVAGHSVWWDQGIGQLQPGGFWSQDIREAIRSSYAFVMCVSETSMMRRKSWIYPEIIEAIDVQRSLRPGQVFIIPVRLSECEVPALQIDAVRNLQDLQRFDYYGRRADIGELVRVLDTARRQSKGEAV